MIQFFYKKGEFEFDTGLQFNRMRYYNSYLGRFASKDIINFLKDFLYNFNNSINYLDPMGYAANAPGPGIYIICALKVVLCPDSASNSCYRECKDPCKEQCKQECASYGMSGFFAFPCIWACECACYLGCTVGCGCSAT